MCRVEVQGAAPRKQAACMKAQRPAGVPFEFCRTWLIEPAWCLGNLVPTQLLLMCCWCVSTVHTCRGPKRHTGPSYEKIELAKAQGRGNPRELGHLHACWHFGTRRAPAYVAGIRDQTRWAHVCKVAGRLVYTCCQGLETNTTYTLPGEAVLDVCDTSLCANK